MDFVFGGGIGSDDFFDGLDGGSRCLFLFICVDFDCFYVSRACFLYRVFFPEDIVGKGSFSNRCFKQDYRRLA